MKPKRVLMAVGSSGGHIFPSVAVAEALKQLSPESKVSFVHSGSPIGRGVFSSLSLTAYEIPLGGLAQGQSFTTRLKTLLQLPLAFVRAFLLIKKQNIEVVLGTGGAVTGVVLLTARLMGRPTALWEGNAVCGLANRLLLPFVLVVFTVFEKVPSVPKKKQIFSGYPLRKSFVAETVIQKESEERFQVLILGGSQGSMALNRTVSSALCEDDKWREGISFFHQTGERDFIKRQEEYQGLKDIECFKFHPNIRKYYELCHVIFSRAGSGIIAEVSALGRSLVLIPLSHSAGGHQMKNALNLYEKGHVELIHEKDFTPEKFKATVLELKNNKEKREKLSREIRKNHTSDGALTMARWLLQQS